VEVEGELRSREYEKGGVTHRVFERRVEAILKLDRATGAMSPKTATIRTPDPGPWRVRLSGAGTLFSCYRIWDQTSASDHY